MPAPDPLRAAWPGPSLHGAVVVVGNAPGVDAAAAIDAGASVVRFNNAAGFGERAGSHVTHLVLVNRGGQMREWLDDPGFCDRPVVRRAQAFVLPFPMLPEAHNRPEPICFTREALAMLRPLGKPVHILPEELHEAARAGLAPLAGERPNPSTGFLTVLAHLAARPGAAGPVGADGCGFAGWPGHPWAAERAWCSRAAAAGRLRLHPPPTDA